MNYSKVQIKNLQNIYESEEESLNAKDFVDENGVKLKDSNQIVKELIALGLIEIEVEEDVYYLTDVGYSLMISDEDELKKNRRKNLDKFRTVVDSKDELLLYKGKLYGLIILIALIIVFSIIELFAS